MKVKNDSRLSHPRVDRKAQLSPADASSQRARKVLKAAGNVFLKYGYTGTSLEMIVAKSGGSYRDLYQTFGGKEALFIRVMTSLCEEVLSPLRDLALNEASKQQALEDGLLAIGRSFLPEVLSPRRLALLRLIVSESPRFPALGKLFYDLGPARVNDTIANFLKARARDEGLVLPDPRAAGAIFIHSLISGLELRALTGSSVTGSEVEHHLQEVVRIFLDGIRQPR